MKSLRIAYTSNGNILAIGKVTNIPTLLEEDERIVNNWYYSQPRELESFLLQNPDKEEYVLKAFAYWVENKIFGLKETQKRYGKLKNELQKFSKALFKALRAIAGKIGEDIKKFLNPSPKKIEKQIKFICKKKS